MTTSLQGTDDGTGFGVKGVSTVGDGVIGTAQAIHKVGVRGINTGHRSAVAVRGELGQGIAAVQGVTGGGSGVGGDEVDNSGVWGDSSQGPGVTGTSATGSGVLGEGTIGVHGVATGSDFAGFFDGKVGVTHDLNVNGDINTLGDIKLIGADLAEEFAVCGELEAEPGCVMVLAGDDQVQVSREAYDRRVAGVVSGAGSYRPGLILDRRTDSTRRPLALTGKVWCRVDADWGRVQIGDLLTTSPTPGHAMRADDPARAFGAVIGKALGSLASGQALVPVLVALQ